MIFWIIKLVNCIAILHDIVQLLRSLCVQRFIASSRYHSDRR